MLIFRRILFIALTLTSVFAAGLLAPLATAEARLFKFQPPAPGPLVPVPMDAPDAPPVVVQPAIITPAIVAPTFSMGPAPCIKYRHAGLRKVKSCTPPISTVLCVKDPCTRCLVSVPVCLPGCCCDEPTVTSRPTLLANGTVTYEWCCGVSVAVRFQRDGEILVTYRGA